MFSGEYSIFRDLETKRLFLKSISHEDDVFFFKQYSSDEVNRYLYDAEPCSSVAEAVEWIDFYPEEEPGNQHRWVLILKENGEKIGTCGFHCWNREQHEAELGYDLWPTYWKHGYIQEAVGRIIDFAAKEMGVKTVFAHISVNNAASIRTALKLCFVRSGKQYDEEYHGQKYLHDIYVKRLSEDAKKGCN